MKLLRMPGTIPQEELKQLEFNSKDADKLAGRCFPYASRFLNNICLFSRIELSLESLYVKRMEILYKILHND
ncbi:hypothetical protein [Coxiella endosymbiont of Ornithodoros amblus]|uniref:hypothetical protein n=1 Tax=Coxiella endosymbiont of Ornithodoros amblus TaxID=1656166 RepID=UPI00244DC33E|nr:hypothetical protein [Coxiella endosymbiont of Ornithodoros amblus]